MMPNTTPDIMPLGGFPIIRSTTAATIEMLKSRMNQGQTALVFANTNFIVKCQALKESFKKSDTVIVNDGIGLDIAAWLVHHKAFTENHAGTDFIPEFLQSIKTEARVFLLGGKPGIANRAATTLQQKYAINVVGTRNGYEDAQNIDKLIADINDSKANVLLVAMGNPFQEQWINNHRHKLSVEILMGVGACLDFLAGDKPRAPDFVKRLRMEWFYRLCLEPSRLAKRYTIDITVFLYLCLRQGKSLG